MGDPSGARTPWGLASLEGTDMQQGTAPSAEDKGKGSEALAVAAYMRVSTAEQMRRYGIPAQADATRTFVERRSNWRLAGSWEDLGESGATTSRPGLNELLAEIAVGRVDVVLVSSLDRLGRTEAAIWRCLWQIEDAGAGLECCDRVLGEPGLDRWLTLDRLARAVEADYCRIVTRTQSGRQLKAVGGGWPGGPAPFGYRISGKGAFGSTLEVDSTEAAVVRLLADLVIEGGQTLTDLAEELNRRGIPTRSGKRWTTANLHRRLKSAAFLGEAVFRRTDQQWGGHCTRLDGSGQPLYGESVVIPLPPILSADRTRAFQQALTELARPRRNPLGEYPLTGRIHGPCGRPYVGCFRSKDGVRTYRCSGWQEKVPCGCFYLRADHVEEQVARHVDALLASMPPHARPMLPSASETQRRLDLHAERVRSLERLVAQCAEELEGLRCQAPNSRVVAAALRQLDADRRALERVLAHARDWLAELEARVLRDVRLTDVLGVAAPDSQALLPSEQRSLIEQLQVRVDIVDAEFRYREGTKCSAAQWHGRTGVTVPADPTDSSWARIDELLRSRYRPHHFRSPLDLRAALTGMLHRLRTGILWRDLPERFGDPRKVRFRQRTWLADGVWAEIVELLGDGEDGTPVLSHGAAPELSVRSGRRR
ncbi:recombinase family protein [Streptomyces sp. A2-16]|uniref:recombinase family protein n=1 Tax=Streptomyces sp. A2-16 TaxID=2781734 RepID=UPI001BAEDD3A|nr:recombinase family protein [Streptomyces sp. A2-16]QUC56978.1 recombinase family protein [Streptomyces sp. A2-16]